MTQYLKTIALLSGILLLSIFIIATGETEIALFSPLSEVDKLILLEVRLPRLLISFSSGVALAGAGLLLQVFFRNPLAGPFVLGVHSGASLGVALFVLGGASLGLSSDLLYDLGVPLSSTLGSSLVILALLMISFRFEHYGILLVVGLLISYLCGGVINIIIVSGAPQEIRSFLLWGLGSFEKLSFYHSLYYALSLFSLSVLPMFFAKKLDIFALGEDEAISMGINTKSLKIVIVLISSVLSGLVTAFCGPIVFVGMIAPHVARYFSKKSFFRYLIPQTLLLGGLFALTGEWLVVSVFDQKIPVNSVFGLIGAPVIVFLILKSKEARVL